LKCQVAIREFYTFLQNLDIFSLIFTIKWINPYAETLAAIREIEEMRIGLIPKQSMSVADFAKKMGE